MHGSLPWIRPVLNIVLQDFIDRNVCGLEQMFEWGEAHACMPVFHLVMHGSGHTSAYINCVWP